MFYYNQFSKLWTKVKSTNRRPSREMIHVLRKRKSTTLQSMCDGFVALGWNRTQNSRLQSLDSSSERHSHVTGCSITAHTRIALTRTYIVPLMKRNISKCHSLHVYLTTSPNTQLRRRNFASSRR